MRSRATSDHINAAIDRFAIHAATLVELLIAGTAVMVAAIVGSVCVQAAACYEQSRVGFQNVGALPDDEGRFLGNRYCSMIRRSNCSSDGRGVGVPSVHRDRFLLVLTVWRLSESLRRLAVRTGRNLPGPIGAGGSARFSDQARGPRDGRLPGRPIALAQGVTSGTESATDLHRVMDRGNGAPPSSGTVGTTDRFKRAAELSMAILTASLLIAGIRGRAWGGRISVDIT